MNWQSEMPPNPSGSMTSFIPMSRLREESEESPIACKSVIAPFEFRCLTGKECLSLSGGGVSWRRQDGDVSPEGSVLDIDCNVRGDVALIESIERARREGVEEGEARGRREACAAFDIELQRVAEGERQRIRHEIDRFVVARDRYFADIEHEIVKLVLAIAARVLHREAMVDPLLLNGVVRVALETMAERSGVVLRVPSGEVETWTKFFESTEPSKRPRVIEDPHLARGECQLDTAMGTVELGIRVQLEEIEKGFLDLLNHRPAQ